MSQCVTIWGGRKTGNHILEHLIFFLIFAKKKFFIFFCNFFESFCIFFWRFLSKVQRLLLNVITVITVHTTGLKWAKTAT